MNIMNMYNRICIQRIQHILANSSAFQNLQSQEVSPGEKSADGSLALGFFGNPSVAILDPWNPNIPTNPSWVHSGNLT